MRWPTVKRNTELGRGTGEKPVILRNKMRKWRWISHTLPKGVESVEKTSIGLESEWNGEKKAEANLKNDRFGRNS